MEGIINATGEVFKSAMIIAGGILVIFLAAFFFAAIGPNFIPIEREGAPEVLAQSVPRSLEGKETDKILRIPTQVLNQSSPEVLAQLSPRVLASLPSDVVAKLSSDVQAEVRSVLEAEDRLREGPISIHNSWTDVMWTITVAGLVISAGFAILWQIALLPVRFKLVKS